ncbi:MAG: hypothetical protein ACJZ12_00020 [Candidatus Neomarinimicrobiota bacterium]
MTSKKRYDAFKWNQRGFAMTSTTIFMFLVISIFAIYLARYTITSRRSSAYLVQEIRARNLSQTGLDIALNAVSSNYNELRSSGFSGTLNKGTYDVVLDEDAFHDDSSLPYHHLNVIESVGKLAEVKRNARILISSYPNAFNLSFFNENHGSTTFGSNSVFNDDIYINGNTSGISMGSDAHAYSSMGSPSSPLIAHGSPYPEFPSHDGSYYTSLINSVTGEYESESGGGGETGSSTQTIWDPHSGHCPVCNESNNYHCSCWGGFDNSHDFNDFVPAGSLLIRASVKFEGATPCGGTWNVAPALNGHVIKNHSWYGGNCQCNSCNSTTAGGSLYNDGFPGYDYGQVNTLSFSYSGTCTCLSSVYLTLEYAGGSSPGEAENETISLSSFSNNTLMHDGDLTLTGCTINGPGTIIASGDVTINGSSTIGSNVNIISGDNMTFGGTSTIGSSVQDYSLIYCSGDLSMSGATFHGVLMSKGQSTSISSSNLYGAIYIESSSVSISSTPIVGSLVSKYSPTINSGSITKGDLPNIFNSSVGFEPSVVAGSHYEY